MVGEEGPSSVHEAMETLLIPTDKTDVISKEEGRNVDWSHVNP